MVADYGHAFRMKVIACDLQPIEDSRVEQVDFGRLMERSDVLSVHIHLTPENKRLIGKEAFARMKPGIVIINTSRGGIIDEEAFLESLQNGKVAAAGVDVIDGEWSENLANHPLIRYAGEHSNLLISPHVGGITFETNTAAFRHSIKKLKEYLIQLKEGECP